MHDMEQFGVKVADMDELMFNESRGRDVYFRSINYNIEEFVRTVPHEVALMKKEWLKTTNGAEVIMIWPSWLTWFPLDHIDQVVCLVRNKEDWLNCIEIKRDPELKERMAQSDPQQWALSQLKYIPNQYRPFDVVHADVISLESWLLRLERLEITGRSVFSLGDDLPSIAESGVRNRD
jgi:hypothetical protein